MTRSRSSRWSGFRERCLERWVCRTASEGAPLAKDDSLCLDPANCTNGDREPCQLREEDRLFQGEVHPEEGEKVGWFEQCGGATLFLSGDGQVFEDLHTHPGDIVFDRVLFPAKEPS